MPVYDYKCNACGKDFAIAQSYRNYEKNKGKIRCIECNSSKIKRIIFSSPVIYKDNGFTLQKSKAE